MSKLILEILWVHLRIWALETRNKLHTITMVWIIIRCNRKLCILQIWYDLYTHNIISKTTVLRVLKVKADQVYRIGGDRCTLT